MKTRRAVHSIALLSLLAGVSACGSDRLSSGSVEPMTGAPAARVMATALAPGGAPSPDMTGRWMLTSPGLGTCVMNFGNATGSPEGTIAPEGGCPGDFFTSRRWIFEKNALVIRNHNGEPLAQLSAVTPMRFDGQSNNGESISLVR